MKTRLISAVGMLTCLLFLSKIVSSAIYIPPPNLTKPIGISLSLYLNWLVDAGIIVIATLSIFSAALTLSPEAHAGFQRVARMASATFAIFLGALVAWDIIAVYRPAPSIVRTSLLPILAIEGVIVFLAVLPIFISSLQSRFDDAAVAGRAAKSFSRAVF